MKNNAVVETQPLPKKGHFIVQDLLRIVVFGLSKYEPVVQDIKDRGEMGKQKYGTYLMTDNGRDADLDLYQELCDAIIYSTQGALEEGDEGQLEIRVNDTDTLFAMAWRCRERLVKKGILDDSHR